MCRIAAKLQWARSPGLLHGCLPCSSPRLRLRQLLHQLLLLQQVLLQHWVHLAGQLCTIALLPLVLLLVLVLLLPGM